MMAVMFILFVTLFLNSSPNPVLSSSSAEFASEQSCNAGAARVAKELKAAYAEHLPRVVTVCVPK